MHEFAVRMYVLRLWHEGTAASGLGVWRASLLNPSTRRRRYFSDLAHLAAYLVTLDPAWPDEPDREEFCEPGDMQGRGEGEE